MSTPAISLEKIQQQAPGLVNLAKTASVSLEKKGLGDHRAAVYLVLDHSGSMQNHYRVGNVQKLADQALGLSVNLDDDGQVPVVFFGDHASDAIVLGLDNYAGAVGRAHQSVPWGYTNYADAINVVTELHLKSSASAPGLVIFQTDGNPYTRSGDAKKAAVKALKDASEHPLFFSFVGFGEEMDFLRRLDDLRVGFGGRKVDNASLFETGHDPRLVSDGALYDGIMHEYPAWLNAARRAGILR
jgi:Mg-chelatase subunit ChlD